MITRLNELNLAEVYKYKDYEKDIAVEEKFLDMMARINEAHAEEAAGLTDGAHFWAHENNLTMFGQVKTAELVSFPSKMSKASIEHDFKIGVFADRDTNSLDGFLFNQYGKGLREMFLPVKEWKWHMLPDWRKSYDRLIQWQREMLWKDDWLMKAYIIVIETCLRADSEGWSSDHIIKWNHTADLPVEI